MTRNALGWRCLAGGLLLLGLASVLVACGSTPAPTPEAHVVHIAAPASTLPLLHSLTSAYEQQAPQANVTFDLQTANSQQAQLALQSGQVDLAVSSWLTSTHLPGLTVAPFAWDAIAVVIHPRNPMTNVTLLQLRDLYRGAAFDWPAQTGPSGDVTLVSREDGSGVRAVFEQTVMGEQAVTPAALVLPSDAAVIDFVATRSAAIGYVSLMGLHHASQGDGQPAQVKTLPVEGVVPTSSNLLDGGYHIVHPFYLLARQPVTAPLQGFIDFVLSPAGQAVVAQYTTRVKT